MSDAGCNLLSDIKALAGPAATIIASIAAAAITLWFNRRQLGNSRQQAAIAQQQASTAREQLRLSLFEKRYAKYNEARNLIRFLVNDSHSENFHSFDAILYFQKLWEARFFFGDEICEWLKRLELDCENFLSAHASGDPMKKFEMTKVLITRLKELQPEFERELKFRNLQPLDAAISTATRQL